MSVPVRVTRRRVTTKKPGCPGLLPFESDQSSDLMFDAWSPFGPVVMSKETF
jgi:hypothetical protein